MQGFSHAYEPTRIAINDLHVYNDNVERSGNEIDEKNEAVYMNIRSDIAGIAKTVDDTFIKEDPCEFVVKGLRVTLALTHQQNTSALLAGLQLPPYAWHVVNWCD